MKVGISRLEPTWRPRLRWPVAACALLVLQSCADAEENLLRSPEDSSVSSPTGQKDQSASDDILTVRGLMEFYQETAQDVVTYADQVSLVTAVKAEPSKKDLEAEDNGGYVTTHMTFRIDETIWQRTGADVLSGTFVANRGSKVTTTINDERERTALAVVAGAPAFRVGHQYLMPLAYNKDEWTPIQPLAEFEVIDGIVSPREGQTSPLAKRLGGSDIEAATEVFASAQPHPLASKYAHLQPSERLKAIGAERRAAGEDY